MMKKKTQSVIDIYLAWPLAIIAILLLGDIVLWLTWIPMGRFSALWARRA